MKIGIYTPYLDSFGGGERYMLTIAEALSKDSTVDLLFDRHHVSLQPESLIADLGEHLDLDLSRINLVPAPLGQGSSFLKRLFFFKKYKSSTAAKCLLSSFVHTTGDYRYTPIAFAT